MNPLKSIETNPRAVATLKLADVIEDWPDAAIMEPDISGMPARDVRLARVIYRTTMQRWYTLVHLLDAHLKKPLWEMEPLMQAGLLGGASQLLFMDRLPSHAVVDESVDLARTLIRPGAAGLANAVLRKISLLNDAPVKGKPWTPAANRLPLEDGFVPLTCDALPSPNADSDDPVKQNQALAYHLEVATSHPRELVLQWIEHYGAQKAISICRHGIVTPPVILSVEPELHWKKHDDLLEPHEKRGFAIWSGWHQDLHNFLKVNPARRVQDPASTAAVNATADLKPKLILDYCAGRGTKTRQLAYLHPQARIVASDTSGQRLADFAQIVRSTPQVSIAPPAQLPELLGQEKVDLLLLDVPCSNSGVLARRPGAKYRYSPAAIASLVKLQREIVEASLPYLSPTGYLLYSTCSLEPEENQQQVQWILSRWPGQVVHEKQMLPVGQGKSYHDGSYHALIKLGA